MNKPRVEESGSLHRDIARRTVVSKRGFHGRGGGGVELEKIEKKNVGDRKGWGTPKGICRQPGGKKKLKTSGIVEGGSLVQQKGVEKKVRRIGNPIVATGMNGISVKPEVLTIRIQTKKGGDKKRGMEKAAPKSRQGGETFWSATKNRENREESHKETPEGGGRPEIQGGKTERGGEVWGTLGVFNGELGAFAAKNESGDRD